MEGDGFAGSLTRHVLFAIVETVREENARAGLEYLKTDGAVDYLGKRKAILALHAYFRALAYNGHATLRRCRRTVGRGMGNDQ